jgi:poly-gamma-glutamate synthesis protein (capsule biosynthesis protein)
MLHPRIFIRNLCYATLLSSITALAVVLILGTVPSLPYPQAHLSVALAQSTTPLPHPTPQEMNKTITLGFVGDIMLDRGVLKEIQAHENDFSFPFSRITNTLKTFDILFGNLEGPVSTLGTDLGNLYSFRMATSAIEALRDAGFDVVSVANNHIGDWGTLAMADTFTRLKDNNIPPVGGGSNADDAGEPRIIERNNIKVAYVGFSEFGKGYLNAGSTTPGITLISDNAIIAGIRQARERADIVVASFHFGIEYADEPNEYQKRVAHLAIDSGADLVIGHHPHIREPLETYRGKTIIYSLGNFVFDQAFSQKTMEAPILSVTFTNGTTTDVHIIPAVMDEDFRPHIPQ